MLNAVDSHQHYWDIRSTFPMDNLPWVMGAVTYGWTQAGLHTLQRSFLPADLAPHLLDRGVSQTIVVNVLHSLAETRWLLDLAAKNSSIAGVVGWVSLSQPRELVQRDLDAFGDQPKLVGLRHLAQFEPDDSWLLRADVLAGLGVLAERHLTYDLLVQPSQLHCVPTLSERLPELRMVIDHIAKPRIRDGEIEPWARDIRQAAANPNVFCKVSGMITEADHDNWTPEQLTPFVEIVVEAFGTERVMFGSDWPVCTLAGSYQQVAEACRFSLDRVVGGLTDEVERVVFRDNAIRFYQLERLLSGAAPTGA